MKKKKPWLKRILLGLLALVVILAGVYWYIATEKFADTKNKEAAYTVNALDFIREFQQDEKKAKEKYSDKIIAVTGIVSATELADTTMNIKFVDSTTGNYAIFDFQKKHLAEAKTVKPGDSISIKAAFSDYTYSSILEVHYITFQRSALNKK